MNTTEPQQNNAVPPPPPETAPSAPMGVGALPQETTRTESLVVSEQGFTSFRSEWPKAVRLIEFQVAPGFNLDKVLIGAVLFENKTWEGRRVERNVVVTTCIHNPGKSGPCQGVWFTEDVPQLDQPNLAQPTPAPAHPPVVNVGAPRGPAPGVATTVQGPPPPVQPQVFHQAQPVPVGQVAMPQAAPPPANMQPGQQYVQHVSGPQIAAAPTGAPVQQQQVQQVAYQGYQQVGGGGQQVIHSGGMPPQHAGQGGSVKAGPGQIVVLLTRERCQKIAFCLKGGILMPQEVPAITYAVEQAFSAPQGGAISPGMNEIALVLTHAHAQRILSVLNGTDFQELQGLILQIEMAAG